MAPKRVLSRARVETLLKWLAIVAGLGFIALFVFSATLRLLYPYEVEWMEGSMIDHAIRVLHGLPIYTAPSTSFVAWLYPPFYYQAVAWMMHLTGEGFLAGRLVSVLATLATCAALAHIVYWRTRSLLLCFFSAALYIAAYHVTGYYFDIARNDALFVLFIVVAAIAANKGTLISGLLTLGILTLAFYVKQQETCFGPLILLWFFLRSRKVGVAVIAAAAVVVAACVLISSSVTHGWFTYYVFDIPAAKRGDFSMFHALRVIPDYLLGPFAVSSLAVIALLWKRGTQIEFWKSIEGLLVLMWFGSLAAGALSLGNEGGYRNVMMPFAALSAAMLPIAIHELAASVRVAGFAWGVLLLQFLALSFDPTGEKMLFAGSRQRAGAWQIEQRIAALPGDVYIPYHGYIGPQSGKPAHAHILAMMDVMRMNDSTADRLARDFDAAYASQFTAVILDESKAFGAIPVKGYRFTGHLIETPNVGITRVADEATRPNLLWVRDTNSK